ncbi:MAG: O-antigen ligase family protein [Clostridiaceae bacterium]|nr:O-antigen ligase family protein [Clostridiaceae bacterium]
MIYEVLKESCARSVIPGALSDGFARLGRRIAAAGRRSAIVTAVRPFFARFDLCRELRERSVLCHAAAVVYGWLLAAVRAVYTAFSHLWPFSWLVRLADWLIHLRVCNLCAVLVAVMLCVDDSYWSNGYMLLAALFVGLLYLIERAKERGETRGRLPVSLYLFMGVSALAIFGGIFVPEAMRVFTYFATSFIFMLVLAGSVRNLRDFRRVFMILYAAVLFTSVFSLLQAHGGVAVNTSYTDVTNNPGVSGRVYATFYNPNNFAEILVLLTPCAIVSFLTEERVTKAAKVLVVLSGILPLVALVLTLSRSAWISFALCVGSFIALANLKLIPLFLILAVLAIPFLPSSITNRVLSLFTGNDTSMGYRLYIWEASLKALKADPLTGGGLGTYNFFDAYRKFMVPEACVATHAHNMYLEIWLETGLFGFLSIVTLYFSTLKNTLLSALRGDRNFRYAAMAVFSTLFGMFFIEMVEYIWFYPRVMLVFWSVLGLAWALLRSTNEEPSKISG